MLCEIKVSKSEEKIQQLNDILKSMESAAIGFSGGVDSTFLLKVARDVLGDHVHAITVVTELHPEIELKEAKRLASEMGVHHIVDHSIHLTDEKIFSNLPDRCYYCKREIFTRMKTWAEQNGVNTILDGSNVDDDTDYRPGMRALEELGIRSPLKEAGLTKKEIRLLSKQMGLSTWDKPALACLASRVPYGDRITPEKLKRIDHAENVLRNSGFKQSRVRDHGSVARIEVLPNDHSKFLDREVSTKIIQQFKALGYQYVALDLEGYRSGSMNEVFKKNE